MFCWFWSPRNIIGIAATPCFKSKIEWPLANYCRRDLSVNVMLPVLFFEKTSVFIWIERERCGRLLVCLECKVWFDTNDPKTGLELKGRRTSPGTEHEGTPCQVFWSFPFGVTWRVFGQETGRNELSLNMETRASCRDIGFIDLRITCTLAGFVHYFGGNPPMNNQQSLLVQGWYYPEGMVFRHNTAVEFQITMKSSIRAECQSVVYIHTGVTPVFLCDSG